MDNTTAAARLGLPESEIRETYEHEAGPVIVTKDGIAYIDVPADQPDGEGKTGVMYLSAPHDRYGDAFPVYAAPELLDEDVVRDTPVMTKADLVARAKELGIDATGKWGEPKLLKAIAEAEAAASAGGQAGGEAGDPPTPDEIRTALEVKAVELGIDNAAELDDDELAEAVKIAGGDE